MRGECLTGSFKLEKVKTCRGNNHKVTKMEASVINDKSLMQQLMDLENILVMFYNLAYKFF